MHYFIMEKNISFYFLFKISEKNQKRIQIIFFLPSTHILRYAGKFSGIRHSKVRMLEKKGKSYLFLQKYAINSLFRNQVNDLNIIPYSDEETEFHSLEMSMECFLWLMLDESQIH